MLFPIFGNLEAKFGAFKTAVIHPQPLGSTSTTSLKRVQSPVDKDEKKMEKLVVANIEIPYTAVRGEGRSPEITTVATGKEARELETYMLLVA